MSSSSSKPPDQPTTTSSNPQTPLSPFPSTPHRLSYILNPFNNPNSNSTEHSPTTTTTLAEHISPTKAAATTRLNHEISTITAWLESLFPEDVEGVPSHLLKWKGEVLAAAQGGFDRPVFAGGVGSQPGSGYETGTGQVSSQAQGPLRPGHPSRTATTTSTGPTTATTTTTTTTTTNEVLDSLKQLKQINLSSDHLASLLHDARLEELQTLQTRQSSIQKQREDGVHSRILLDEVYSFLTPDATDALRSLAEAGVTLGIDLDRDLQVDNGDGGVKDLTTLFAQAILEQTRRKFMLEEQVRELDMLREQIQVRFRNNAHPEATGHTNEEDGEDRENVQLHAQTAQYNRDTKQINLKIMEYHDRITSLERQLAGLRRQSTSLENVLNARARVEDRRARVKALQDRFAAFNGLPPDLEDSRNEVRRAMAELETLKRHREGLFERMGTG